jgi:hypothetical protein
MSSDHLFHVEMRQAMLQHTQKGACVIPVILRPTHWQVTPLNGLQPLPLNAKPIVLWHDRDEAFMHIVNGIRTILAEKFGLMGASGLDTSFYHTQAIKDLQQLVYSDKIGTQIYSLYIVYL